MLNQQLYSYHKGFYRVAYFIRKSVIVVLLISGMLFFVMIFLAFTRIPFDIHRWLGEHHSEWSFKPETIIMLGGSGMPSESNLIRLYYTSVLAKKFNQTDIIIAHPKVTAVADSMKAYLFHDGIEKFRITGMLKGTNTREQAQQLLSSFPLIENKNCVIVTSPENMCRSVATFRKCGFKNIGGAAAFENAMFIDLGYDFGKAGGKKYVPDISSNISLRYNFWNYLKLEITCLREFFAIAYYKLNGWA